MGIQDSRVVGLPLVNFTNTKANLLAITGPEVGMTAYATDTGELGFYSLAAWHWWNPDAVNHLVFVVSPTGVPDVEGAVCWNHAEMTLDLNTGIGPVMQVGHETYALVYNDTGAQLDNGTVVRPTGVYYSGIPGAAEAIADSSTTISRTVGILTMDIPDGQAGLATLYGKVRGVDTSMYSTGARLWISDTVLGGHTDTMPMFPSYAIAIGGVAVSHATEGVIYVNTEGRPIDTTLNFWNGCVRESFAFTVGSNGTVVTGYLDTAEAIDFLTLLLSDGLTALDVSYPLEITLTPGTDSNPQTNYVYIPKSTKALAVSTSDWPVTVEHIRIATIVLRSAATTKADGALRNQNWNDHIQAVGGQGHLSHIGERIRQEAAKWDAGVEGSVTVDATPSPDDVWAKVTGGVVYQMHRQNFPILDMTQYTIDAVSTGSQTFTISDDGDLSSTFPDGRNIQVNGSTGNDAIYTVASTLWSSPDFVITVVEAIPSAVADGAIGDDIHVVNHSTTAFLSTTNLNTQTLDATGDPLANSSFAFVVWGVANLSGQESHLMLNLPVGSYGRLSPEDAVSDAENYSVYDIPKQFQGVGFLIARFVFQLQPGGLAWTLYATEDLRGKIPNVTAGGGGGGGGGATTWLALTDTPSAFVASRMVKTNSSATGLEFVADQAAGAFYAGPSVAPAAAPGFRAMVAADIAVAAASYAYLPGRAGGQVLNGGTGAGENLTLSSTAHATKGKVLLGSASAYSEVDDRLGLGTTTPTAKLEVYGDTIKFASSANDAQTWFPYINGEVYITGDRDGTGNGDIHLRSFGEGSYKERMTIEGDTGNVGIAATSPVYKLSVIQDTLVPSGGSSTFGLGVYDSNSEDVALLFAADATNSVGAIQAMHPAVSWTTRNLALQPRGGDVSIGTIAPLDKLHVQGAVLREGWFCGRAGTQTGFTGALTDIDIDTEIRKDSTYFTHAAGSDNITHVKTGWYRISYSIDIANSLSNNSCVRVRVYDDGAAILQSYGYCNLDYYNYGQYATVSNSFLAYIVAGSVIDIRTDGQGGTGSFGSGCNYTVLDSSQITIERVDQ